MLISVLTNSPSLRATSKASTSHSRLGKSPPSDEVGEIQDNGASDKAHG